MGAFILTLDCGCDVVSCVKFLPGCPYIMICNLELRTEIGPFPLSCFFVVAAFFGGGGSGYFITVIEMNLKQGAYLGSQFEILIHYGGRNGKLLAIQLHSQEAERGMQELGLHSLFFAVFNTRDIHR